MVNPAELVQAFGPMAGVFIYLLYEMRRGTIGQVRDTQRILEQKVDTLSNVLIATVKDHPNVDEDRVAQALNEDGVEPEDFRTQTTDDRDDPGVL